MTIIIPDQGIQESTESIVMPSLRSEREKNLKIHQKG
jgi:hypothetical protein